MSALKFRKPLVAVVWEDAHGVATGDYTEEDVTDFHKPAVYTAIGILVRDDATGITLASEQSDTGFRGMAFLPRGMVKSIEPITLGAKPRRKKPEAQAPVPEPLPVNN